jgi:hypothetical protein
MNKRHVIFMSVVFIFIMIKLESRVLFSPSINDWLWYTGTIEYPLEFYFYNKRSFFCWDVGVSIVSRYADLALTNHSLEFGTNLSLLFHGADEFVLTDCQPLPNTILAEGEYQFLPDYIFNETDFQFNLQVSKDFEYSSDRYVHSTVRCIVPFAKQAIVNIAAGNMYYNTTADRVKKKLYRDKMALDERGRKGIAIKNGKNKIKIKEKQCSTSNAVSLPRSTLSPYIQIQKDGDSTLFAINGQYFTQSDQNIFNVIENQITFPYVVFNKNAAPGYLYDDNNDYLSLDEVCHSYSLLNDQGGMLNYAQLVGTSESFVVDANGVNYVVKNTPFQYGMSPNSALISLYTYGKAGGEVSNAVYVNDPYGISYPIVTEPDYISDVTVGDLVTSASLLYGDGSTGAINQANLDANTILKVVATGPYGDNPFLSEMWARDRVKFIVPPVVVQYNNASQFPVNFGIVANLGDLTQPYNESLDGVQFSYYGDYLSSNVLNTSPRVTLLNPDGTFYDSTADYAILWYENDYTQLFNKNNTDGVLNNLFLTSAIDPQTQKPTQTSTIIADKITDAPTPDTCCDEVVTWVQKCIYYPLAVSMYRNFKIMQSEIESLVNVGNSVIGNTSPIMSNQPGEVNDQPCDYPYVGNDYRGGDSKKDFIENSSVVLNRLVDNNVTFKNGVYESMQYNGFHQSGLGNIIFEFLVGSYFLRNTSLVDLYVAFELPTAQTVNEDSSYLTVGIGNNGHYVGRIGLQGCLDLDYVVRLRLTSKFYLEHGFSGLEKLVPQLTDYPIFNFIPVKMDTLVSWNGGLFYIDGSLYTNDYSGVTLSYQYWEKGMDDIRMINPVSITVPNTFEIDTTTNEVVAPDLQIAPMFEEPMKFSKRKTHTFGASVFSRITNELTFNCGMSRVFAGENAPAVFDLFASFGLSY